MNDFSPFLKKVLQKLEPDETKWEYWTKHQSLSPRITGKDADAFVSRILKAKENHEKVFILGDYDADGILGTSILVYTLRSLGIEAGFYIPDRIREGYGLKTSHVKSAHDKGYSIVITVDNGIHADEAIDYAKNQDMDVIVSDHHSYIKEPNADIVLHPFKLEKEYQTLCGAGMAFEMSRLLIGENEYLLSLAAVASVADCMKVKGETRAIIQNGLDIINHSGDYHIRGLCSESVINEKTLGFQVCPKLNAIGRLANMANANNGVRYFLCFDPVKQEHIRAQINQINDKRKQLTTQMSEIALGKVGNSPDNVLVVYDDSFHEGIIGLIAQNLSKKYQRPAIVLTITQNGYKGSMRAPEGFNCMDFLACFEHFRDCGGHENAAGFTIDLDDYEKFRQYCRSQDAKAEWKKTENEPILVDSSEITVSNIKELDKLRPFGEGFRLPDFEIIDPPIKNIYNLQNGRHRRYVLNNGVECMRFNQPEKEYYKSSIDISSLVGSLELNTFQGRVKPNMIIDKIRYKSDRKESL